MVEATKPSKWRRPLFAARLALKDWLYSHDTIIKRGRTQRMLDMIQLLNLPEKCRVIDLGGMGYVWELFDHDFDITLVNLPDGNPTAEFDSNRFTCVTGDACDLANQFADNSFDLAFSNSVIEHVGDETRQQQFANEIKRLAKAYWVQTPSSKFPFEIHTGKPLYWQRRKLMGKELRLSPHLCVLTRRQMKDLFTDGQVYTEKLLGFEKSYTMYRTFIA